MAASDTSFNVGRDCSLVLMGPFGRVDLKQIVGFQARQEVKKPRINPLNAPPIERHLPGGWTGTFEIDRADSTGDDLAANIEAGFWNGQQIAISTMYQYIAELDGSTSTYQFNTVALNLSDAGHWQQETQVKQTVEFFASTRRRVS